MNTASLFSLRFVAAIIVVLFHESPNSTLLKTAPKILTAGSQAASLFFVLSGFILALAHYNDDKFSVGKFYQKRMARIMPVYLIALSLWVTLDIAKGQLDPIAIGLNIFLLQSWFPSYPLSINAPAWFLSDLTFFYIAFPFILALLKKYSTGPKGVLLSGIIFWLITQAVLTVLLNTSFYEGYPSRSHDYIYYFPPSHLCSFVLGICGAYFLLNNKDRFPMTYSKSVSIILLLIAVIAIDIEYQAEFDETSQLMLPFDASFYAPLLLLLIMSFCVSDQRIAAALSWRPLVYLGKISFSVYILQSPVNRILRLRGDKYQLSDDEFILFFIFVLIIVGMLMRHAVEQPINAYLSKRSGNPDECPTRQ